MPQREDANCPITVVSASRIHTSRVFEFIAERTCLACGQRRALTTGKHQHQRELNDDRERASAEGKIETMSPYPTNQDHESEHHFDGGREATGKPLLSSKIVPIVTAQGLSAAIPPRFLIEGTIAKRRVGGRLCVWETTARANPD